MDLAQRRETTALVNQHFPPDANCDSLNNKRKTTGLEDPEGDSESRDRSRLNNGSFGYYV
jgi:hypothetical protein